MTDKELQSFIRKATGGSLTYDQPAKGQYHRAATKVLRALAEKLGLPEGSFDIRTNMGGIAVVGETTLHGENIYIQLSQTEFGFMYRSCKGRRDYAGGTNCWMRFETLADLDAAAAIIRKARA